MRDSDSQKSMPKGKQRVDRAAQGPWAVAAEPLVRARRALGMGGHLGCSWG